MREKIERWTYGTIERWTYRTMGGGTTTTFRGAREFGLEKLRIEKLKNGNMNVVEVQNSELIVQS